MDARNALASTEAQSWDNPAPAVCHWATELAWLSAEHLSAPVVALQAGAERSGTSRLMAFTRAPGGTL